MAKITLITLIFFVVAGVVLTEEYIRTGHQFTILGILAMILILGTVCNFLIKALTYWFDSEPKKKK